MTPVRAEEFCSIQTAFHYCQNGEHHILQACVSRLFHVNVLCVCTSCEWAVCVHVMSMGCVGNHEQSLTCVQHSHHGWLDLVLIQTHMGWLRLVRLLKIIGFFCRIQSFLQGSFAKETYHFKERTHRSHPMLSRHPCMGLLRLVGSLKSQVSFAKEPYKTDYILQKRPTIRRSLLIEATPICFIL